MNICETWCEALVYCKHNSSACCKGICECKSLTATKETIGDEDNRGLALRKAISKAEAK